MSGAWRKKNKGTIHKASKDKKAMIIAEADIYGIGPTVKKWDISNRSYHRYRSEMDTDKELSDLVVLYKRILASSWAEDAVKAIRQAFFEQCARMAQLKTKEDADCFNAITNFLKVAAELKMTSDQLTSDEQLNINIPRPLSRSTEFKLK